MLLIAHARQTFQSGYEESFFEFDFFIQKENFILKQKFQVFGNTTGEVAFTLLGFHIALLCHRPAIFVSQNVSLLLTLHDHSQFALIFDRIQWIQKDFMLVNIRHFSLL